jgi:hypothetical protein
VKELVRYRSLAADNARWEGFAFRDGDIVISTPPKCGTTWTQMLCALLIFRTPNFDRPLDLISPWLEQTVNARDKVFADLAAQTHRRFIKSHTPFDGIPYDERVTYIAVGRDPRDVAISMAHHFDNMDLPAFFALIDKAVGLETLADVMPKELPQIPPDPRDRFWVWVNDETPTDQAISGLPGTLNHLNAFWEARGLPNVVLLHYADLEADLPGQMSRLAERLGIGIDDAEIAELAPAASFEAMRSRASEVAPNATEPIWLDTGRFFHSGRSGQWREILNEDDLKLYQTRVLELVSPEFSAWVHQGQVVT